MSINITIPYEIAKSWAKMGEAEFPEDRAIVKACKEALKGVVRDHTRKS